MFSGAITALITPFSQDGSVDHTALEKHVNWQIEQGIHGLVACGTTAETPTLTHDERNAITKTILTTTNKRVPVMVGTGSNCTRTTIEYTKEAKKAGADAALIVAPYYNKPTQEGIYQHYKAVNDAVDLPIYIYNIPGRSVVNISDETIARLAQLKNIKGIKDSTGTSERAVTLANLLKRDDFVQLCGDDPLAISFNANGGVGCISVASNVTPKECAAMQNFIKEGRNAEALKIQKRLMPLYSAIFCETNPSPTKFALSLMNRANDNVRLPLVTLGDKSKDTVKETLKSLGLI